MYRVFSVHSLSIGRSLGNPLSRLNAISHPAFGRPPPPSHASGRPLRTFGRSSHGPPNFEQYSDALGRAEPRPRLVQPLDVLLALERPLGQKVRELGRVLLEQPLPLRLDDVRALLLRGRQPALLFQLRLALQGWVENWIKKRNYRLVEKKL